LKPIEEHIIQLLRSDRREAVSKIHDHYADTLYGVVFSMLGDEALSKDALQECLIKVWKNAGSFDHKKARLFTWLLRIARNTAIDKLRVEGRRSEVMIQNQDSNVNKVEQGLNIDHIDIHKHIHELDVKYSKVIYALFFRGLTQEEASKSLEIPVGTVKSRLRIGLRELKSIYQDPLVLLILMELWK